MAYVISLARKIPDPVVRFQLKQKDEKIFDICQDQDLILSFYVTMKVISSQISVHVFPLWIDGCGGDIAKFCELGHSGLRWMGVALEDFMD